MNIREQLNAKKKIALASKVAQLTGDDVCQNCLTATGRIHLSAAGWGGNVNILSFVPLEVQREQNRRR